MQASDIQHLTSRLRDEFGFDVRLCGEIEWLFHHEGAVPDAFFQRLLEKAQQDEIPLESIGREKTDHASVQQYEFRFKAQEPLEAVQALTWLEEVLQALAAEANIALERRAYAPEFQLASGLHWHLHLLAEGEHYAFLKQEDEMSAPLEHSIGGLLATMPALMPYFMPSDAAYERLRSGADHVPTKQCWGGNNRSTAIRLPESVIPLRHIEHRVCGADADYTQSVWAILVGLHYGFKHQPELPQQCYGDANRPESVFPLLPKSAEAVPEDVEWLADYL